MKEQLREAASAKQFDEESLAAGSEGPVVPMGDLDAALAKSIHIVKKRNCCTRCICALCCCDTTDRGADARLDDLNDTEIQLYALQVQKRATSMEQNSKTSGSDLKEFKTTE